MSCLNYKHPFKHNGTSQLERIAPELLPDSVQLDDRDTKDLLNFAYEFGSLLTYFNPQNEEDGNWQCFFSGGALGLLSIITSIDLEAIDACYRAGETPYDDDQDFHCLIEIPKFILFDEYLNNPQSEFTLFNAFREIGTDESQMCEVN